MKISKIVGTGKTLALTLIPESEAETALLGLASGSYGNCSAPTEILISDEAPETEGTSFSVVTLQLRN